MSPFVCREVSEALWEGIKYKNGPHGTDGVHTRHQLDKSGTIHETLTSYLSTNKLTIIHDNSRKSGKHSTYHYI